MSLSPEQLEASQIVEVHGSDRWLAYRRLQELSIPCQCQMNQPLRVQIDHAIAAIQTWSVCQQLTAPRYKLIEWLDSCWNLD